MDISDLIPLSNINDLVWPAYTNGNAATVHALKLQLEKSQWWNPEQLFVAQFNQLVRLLQHVIATVPHYKSCLKNLAWGPGTSLTRANWQELPILSRIEAQKSYGALWSLSLDPAHGSTTEVHTSGSTGIPIKITKTTACDLMFSAIN